MIFRVDLCDSRVLGNANVSIIIDSLPYRTLIYLFFNNIFKIFNPYHCVRVTIQ